MKISIIGPGRVGATLAYTLALKGLASEIVLVGRNRRRAAGEALDIEHAQLFLRAPLDVRAGEIADVAGSKVIAICASAPTPDDMSDRNQLARENVALMREMVPGLVAAAPEARFVVVTNPVDVITWQILQLSGLPAHQVMGTGTLVDSARFRDALSQQVGIHPADIRSYVLGEHGNSQFAAMSVAQSGADSLEDTPERRELFARTAAAGFEVFQLKGNTCYAVAMAAAEAIESIVLDARHTMPLSIRIDDFCGVSGVCLSLPVVVGARGIERVLRPPLNEAEQAAFRRCAEVVRGVIEAVGVQDG